MFSERKGWSLDVSRAKIAWPAGKPFKILSLDGGGIRGVFASTLLTQLERRFGPIADYFDLMAGTSTGGIIAIGLGLGIKAEQIDSVYKMDGESIFPPFHAMHPWARAGTALRRFFRPAHNHYALVSALKREFKDRKLGESTTRLVVPAFVGPDPQVAVFKKDHHPDYRRDWKTEAWKVARATSAAPTFFEAHQDGHAFFLDGGVWANNPILCAVVEALTAYDVSAEQIKILSIGTGSVGERLSEKRIRSGFIGWRSIINTAMFLTSDSHHGLASLLVGAGSIVRLDPTGEELPDIQLDDWTNAMKYLPEQADKVFSAQFSELEHFFVDRVSPRERHYSSSWRSG